MEFDFENCVGALNFAYLPKLLKVHNLNKTGEKPKSKLRFCYQQSQIKYIIAKHNKTTLVHRRNKNKYG